VSEERRLTARQFQFASWSVYLLIDIVVLNLFVEFSDSVVIDSFYISILTAVLLRLLLGATLHVEHRVARYFAAKTSPASKAVRWAMTFLILFTSKFVILEVVDLVFRAHVNLGGFVGIVVIALALIAAETAFRALFNRLGNQTADALDGVSQGAEPRAGL
jgi:hypothetical protein